jgi:hypothetical protein
MIFDDHDVADDWNLTARGATGRAFCLSAPGK